MLVFLPTDLDRTLVVDFELTFLFWHCCFGILTIQVRVAPHVDKTPTIKSVRAYNNEYLSIE